MQAIRVLQADTRDTATMTLLRVALLAAALALAVATNVEDCGSTASVSLVVISGCDVPPCQLQRGINVTVDIDLTIKEATATLATNVTGTIESVVVPWSGVDPNACNDLTKGDCPLEVGEASHYKAIFPVLADYPPVDVIVTWKLIAASGKTAVCFVVPVTLS